MLSTSINTVPFSSVRLASTRGGPIQGYGKGDRHRQQSISRDTRPAFHSLTPGAIPLHLGASTGNLIEPEIFFRIWKAGCRIEALQLGTLEWLERALLLYLIIAWCLPH
ncbi:MAG: hypothetical protein RKO66_16755 [Candidatus Contendobacter sp.]|nr:hypothetical protein [Candidatus Contendobacter sp.]MDS4060438.1 hypothetical protein [Candidatus Contendobacter sp.]